METHSEKQRQRRRRMKTRLDARQTVRMAQDATRGQETTAMPTAAAAQARGAPVPAATLLPKKSGELRPEWTARVKADHALLWSAGGGGASLLAAAAFGTFEISGLAMAENCVEA
jgi:hypothetical protein